MEQIQQRSDVGLFFFGSSWRLHRPILNLQMQITFSLSGKHLTMVIHSRLIIHSTHSFVKMGCNGLQVISNYLVLIVNMWRWSAAAGSVGRAEFLFLLLCCCSTTLPLPSSFSWPLVNKIFMINITWNSIRLIRLLSARFECCMIFLFFFFFVRVCCKWNCRTIRMGIQFTCLFRWRSSSASAMMMTVKGDLLGAWRSIRALFRLNVTEGSASAWIPSAALWIATSKITFKYFCIVV